MSDAEQTAGGQTEGETPPPVKRPRGRPRKPRPEPPTKDEYTRAQLGHQNTEAQKALRRAKDARMLALALEGRTVREIAADPAVQYTVQNVYKRLPRMLDRLAAENRGLVQRELVQQLGRLDHLLSRALTQFEKSCEAEVEVTREDEGRNPDAAGGATQGTTYAVAGGSRKVTTRRKNAFGDVRFLTEARQILAERRKLLGFDREEVRAQVINQFITADVQVNAQQNNTLEISAQEADEMARIMGSLGLTPTLGDVTGLARALPPPRPARAPDGDPGDDDEGELDDFVEGVYREQEQDREDDRDGAGG